MSINPEIEHASNVPHPSMSRRVQLRQAQAEKQNRADEVEEDEEEVPTSQDRVEVLLSVGDNSEDETEDIEEMAGFKTVAAEADSTSNYGTSGFLDPAGHIEAGESDEEPISKKNSKAAKRARSEPSSPEKPKGRKIPKESE